MTMLRKIASGFRSLRTATIDDLRRLISHTHSGLQLALSGTLLQVPTKTLTNEYASSFAPNGWNHSRSLVAEYERNPHINLEGTTFFRFFQHKQIRAVRYLDDLLFLHDPEKRSRQDGIEFYFGTYPWGDST